MPPVSREETAMDVVKHLLNKAKTNPIKMFDNDMEVLADIIRKGLIDKQPILDAFEAVWLTSIYDRRQVIEEGNRADEAEDKLTRYEEQPDEEDDTE